MQNSMRRWIFARYRFSARRGLFAGAAVALALAVTAGDVVAQQRRPAPPPPVPSPAELGIRGGRDFDAEVWTLGMQFRMPLGPWGRIQLVPSADLIFLDESTAWQVNVDGSLELLPEGMLYGGGGLAILSTEVAEGEMERFTGWGLHIGTKPQMYAVRVRPYVEARWTFIEGDGLFRLVLGLNVPIGPWRAPPVRR
jgi:hypothetical protein